MCVRTSAQSTRMLFLLVPGSKTEKNMLAPLLYFFLKFLLKSVAGQPIAERERERGKAGEVRGRETAGTERHGVRRVRKNTA